jgi:hypothetical protein
MRSRSWTALGIAVVILVGALAWRQGREDARLRVVAENTHKAQALKAQIDMRFPIGTSESLVAAFLEKEHSGYTQCLRRAGQSTECRSAVSRARCGTAVRGRGASDFGSSRSSWSVQPLNDGVPTVSDFGRPANPPLQPTSGASESGWFEPLSPPLAAERHGVRPT